jgi:septal ring factor EnvC (AmiA/AmiB activator)
MTKEIEVNVDKQNDEVKSLTLSAKKYFVIKNKNDLIKATDMSVQIKSKLTELEEERTGYTAPLNATLKKLNSTFKQLTEPLKELQDNLKDAINTFREKEEEKRRLKEEKLRENTGDKKLEIVSKLPDTIEGNLGETRTVRTWTFKILDEKKIQRKYLILDEKKINAEIKAGVRKIPGLEIYEKISTSIYQKRQ